MGMKITYEDLFFVSLARLTDTDGEPTCVVRLTISSLEVTPQIFSEAVRTAFLDNEVRFPFATQASVDLMAPLCFLAFDEEMLTLLLAKKIHESLLALLPSSIGGFDVEDYG
jgi:hypothetical protein